VLNLFMDLQSALDLHYLFISHDLAWSSTSAIA
jgi:ABC-type oligopeptide transport system ATPase subunit